MERSLLPGAAALLLLLSGCMIQSGFGGGPAPRPQQEARLSEVVTPLTWPRPAPDQALAFNSIFQCDGKVAEIGILTDRAYGDPRLGTEPRIAEHTVLRADGSEYILEPVETASGSKYASPGPGPETSFWSKGEEGLLVLWGVEHAGCVRTGGYEGQETSR